MDMQKENTSGGIDKNRKPHLVFMIIFISAILLLEAVGGVIIHSAYVKERRCSVMTEGVLVEWEKWIRNTSAGYRPVVEYRAGDNQYTMTSTTKVIRPTIKKGSRVMIGYNPANPYDFYLKGYEPAITRRFGSIFVIWGATAAMASILCALLGRLDMDEETRVRLMNATLISSVLFVFYWTVIALAGIGMAVTMTLAIAPFVLYVKYKNRKKRPDAPGSQ